MTDKWQINDQYDICVWTEDTSGVFSCISFLSCLNSISTYPSFPVANFLWKSKVPLKERAFVWILALGRITTNGMQQRRPGLAFSPDICVLCYAKSETCSHFFIHCQVAQQVWSMLFWVLGESWICASTVMELLQNSFCGVQKG